MWREVILYVAFEERIVGGFRRKQERQFFYYFYHVCIHLLQRMWRYKLLYVISILYYVGGH